MIFRFASTATLIFMVLNMRHTAPKADAATAHPETCSFSEVYKNEGWNVPGVAGAKVVVRASLKNIPGVFVTKLTGSESEAMITEVRCSGTHPGRIEIEERPISISNLQAFDFNGKLFAYGITYGKEVFENGQRLHVGAASSLIFYDTDGSGKFTLRVDSEFPIWPITVPDWAKTPQAQGNASGPTKP